MGGVGLSPTRARPVDSREHHDESNKRMVRGSPTANTSGMSFNILKSPLMLVFNFPTPVKKIEYRIIEFIPKLLTSSEMLMTKKEADYNY